MADTVTQGQFFEAIHQILDKIDAKHISQREYIGEVAEKFERGLQAHMKEDRDGFKILMDDVLVIKTQREEEKKGHTRKMSLIAGLFSTAIAIALKFLDHLWK